MDHLTTWLVTLEPKWRELGLSLKVKDYKLDSFSQENISNAVRLSKTFVEWRRTTCSPYTFEQLINSLEQREYEDAIKTVKKNLQEKQVRREYSL